MLLTPAPAAAQSVKRIDAQMVARFCPGMESSQLKPGLPISAQDQAFIKSLNRLPPDFTPFTEADLEMTSWSGKLAGITYRGASPDGDANRAWSEALVTTLQNEGWTELSQIDLASPLPYFAHYFERDVDSGSGRRTLFLEFDTPGALVLRCGDLQLFEIQKNEAQDMLEEGSPRPPQLGDLETALRLPDESDCDDPMLLQAFREPGRIDETSEAFQKFAAAGENVAKVATSRQRLVTWLKWKLLRSGKVDQDRLWQLEDKASESAKTNPLTLSEDVLVAVGKVSDAVQAKDGAGKPKAICRSMVGIILAQSAKEKQDSDYNAELARILESEAARLGIDVSG